MTCEVIAQSQNDTTEMKMDSLFRKYNSTTVGVAVSVTLNGKNVFKKG